MFRRISNLSGFVLAGGASRRMGQPKHQLSLDGETLLERQLRRLSRVSTRVAVIGPPDSISGIDVPVFPDEIPGRGPLGGIYTGLLHTRTQYNLFVGCDLPFLEVSLLAHLARCALESQAEVTVPEDREGRVQPLCAIYRREVRAVIRARLSAGDNKTDGYFHRVRCRIILWRELASAGFTPNVFVNMNTPEDLDAARKRTRDPGLALPA